MKTLNVRLTGTRPLLMHNEQLADPLSAAARAVAEMTRKPAAHKKSDEYHEELGRREWEGGMYLDGEVGPYIPGSNIEACIRDGAVFSKLGREVRRSVIVMDEVNPLLYDGPRDVAGLWARPSFRDRRTIKASGRVARTRPRFPAWSLEFALAYDEGRINESDLVAALRDAGTFVGLGDFRPKFGRFEVEVVK